MVGALGLWHHKGMKIGFGRAYLEGKQCGGGFGRSFGRNGWLGAVLLQSLCVASFWGGSGEEARALPHKRQALSQSQKAKSMLVPAAQGVGPVILVVVDALRPDHLSGYGYTRKTSPHMDALAQEGIRFERMYVNGNWTRPSTASILTGLLPSVHGCEAERDKLAGKIQTLPEALQAAGIPTGAVVGNGNAASPFGLAQGFDHYVDTVTHWDGLPNADEVFQEAIGFVQKHKNEDFFLFVFLVDVHDPYHAPGDYEDMFVADRDARLIRTPHWELGRYSPAELRRMVATYDGAIRYTDAAFGRFLGKLKSLGVYDKATVMLTADHGEAFGEHDVFLHSHHLYEEILRVPLIVRTPNNTQKGRVVSATVQGLDLMPTILGHFGMPSSFGNQAPWLHGMDVLAALEDAETLRALDERVVISEFHNFGIRRRTAIGRSHKAIVSEPANKKQFMATVGNPKLLPSVSFTRNKVRFFDLNADPTERVDLFSKSSAQKKPWRDLLQVLAKLQTQTGSSQKAKQADEVAELDPETIRDLRALGYIQ